MLYFCRLNGGFNVMNKNKNMTIWDSVSKTEDKYVKDGQKGLSSINSQYYIKKATETFGPIGIGWGYSVVERYITEGHTIKHKEGDYVVSQMTLKIEFWYKLNGEKGSFEQYGHTPLVMKTKYGAMMDDDPEKKSLTDAVKKSLTFLGVCADVHLGQFDDISYMKDLKMETQQAKEIENEEKIKGVKDDISAYMRDLELSYQAVSTVPAVNGMAKSDISHIRRECQKINIDSKPMNDAITKIANNRKGELSNVKN